MSIPDILVVVAFVLACIDQFRENGRSLTGWAVIFICIALLWGSIGSVLK